MRDIKVEAGAKRNVWARPEVKRLDAGSAEAIQRDGTPDGGGAGASRS